MSVVREGREVFALEDIKAVRLQCRSCSREFLQELDKAAVPVKCPAPDCDQRWVPSSPRSTHTTKFLLGRGIYAILVTSR